MGALVTGATGCLGAALVDLLLAQGVEVTAQGRDPVAGAALERKGARFLPLDLRDPQPLLPHLRGVRTVYHCAALSTAWGRAADFQAINVTATQHLLGAARLAGVGRFVFASSPSIYADGTDRLDLPEDAPLPARFATDYARTKFQAECAVLDADAPGFRTVALRPRAIYGKGDRALMPRLEQAMRRGTLPLIGGGDSLIDVTHVSDAARAMHLAAQAADGAGGRAFNITSGQAYRFRDLARMAARVLGLDPRERRLPYGLAMALASGLEGFHRAFRPQAEPVLTRQAVASLGRSLTLDITAARQVLGYAPRVSLEQGVQDYARA